MTYAAVGDSVCTQGPAVEVDVVGTVTASRTFSAADVHDLTDLVAPTFLIRGGSGSAQYDSEPEATSLRALVAAVPLPGDAGAVVDPDSATYTDVYDGTGRAHPLGRGDLGPAGANGFPASANHDQSLLPAVYCVPGSNAFVYVRPLRDADDVNVSPDASLDGYFQTDSDGTLHITVHTSGTLLAPTVSAARTSLPAGKADSFGVGFGASTAPPGAAYAWSFGDGTGSGATPSHTWAAAGTYWVSVAVTGSDGSSGQSAAVAVTVGPRPKPGPDHHHASGTGTNPDQHAPSHGANTGSGTSTQPPDPSTTPAKPAGGKTGRGQAHHPTTPGERTITGILLSASGSADQATQVVPPPTGAREVPDRVSSGLLWLLLPLAFLALLGAGLLGESGWWRRLRRHDRIRA